MRRGRLRPAGYEHIPEIRADVVTIVASLVLGIAASAASYYLTPKPKPLDAPAGNRRGGGSRTLGSITGADRFAPTFGFDSQAELASYGEPIPIIFARYDDATGTGGVLYSPRLVWSRMFSYGTQQGIKMLFVVGEQGIAGTQVPQGVDPPSLRGIFLGNGVLDSIYKSTFAFYWKRNTTISESFRIKASNLRYGTRGELATGDPELIDDIFACPTANNAADTGFSSAHSLSNNAEFGCYSPIPNGTAYRLNWRVISILKTEGKNAWDDDENYVQTRERRKIAGDRNGTVKLSDGGEWSLGMEGTGRNYSRRMGIIELNGQGVGDSEGTAERSVQIGDRIQFKISARQIPSGFYDYKDSKTGEVKDDNVTVDDINGDLNEQRIAADDALQVGELFMIRRTVWQVTKRRLAIWRPEDNENQIVTLKCIEIIGPDQIGLVADAMLDRNYLSDDNGATNNLHAGTAFYPLLRVAFGLARNTRACDVTEIGIRSRVYQRLNGICNFRTIPSPGQLRSADRKRISIASGTTTSYIRRASAFHIYLRPAGLTETGEEYEWTRIDTPFVIVGNTPVDQYNFIRFKHPERKEYEYRFVPKNSADIRNSADDTVFWQLNANASIDSETERNILSETFSTRYGLFTVTTVGKRVQKNDIRYNVEFTTNGRLSGGTDSNGYPSSVGINSFLPDIDTEETTVSAVEQVSLYSEPSTTTGGIPGSFSWEIFGDADAYGGGEGSQVYADVREELLNGQWITLRYRATKYATPEGHFSGKAFVFIVDQFEVLGSSGDFNILQQFVVKRTLSASNPFRNPPNQPIRTVAGVTLRVSQVRNGSVGQGGRQQAVFEEIFGRAIDYQAGYRRTREVDFETNGRTLRVSLTITAIDQVHKTGRTRIWDPNSLVILPMRVSATSTDWAAGDLSTKFYTVSSGNPFYTQGAQVGIQLIVFGIEVVRSDTTELSAGRVFEGQSQYSDVSFYGSLVEKSNQSSPEHAITYVNEIVANDVTPTYDRMSICGLAIKASRNFNNLDQLRVWLPNGLHVKRFHPDDGGTNGASNLLCDLVYHLLTDDVAGLGNVLKINADTASMMINTDDLVRTAKFLKRNRLFFNGVIGEAINVRQFIADTAPHFLCNFVISDGKFSLLPAVPTTSGGDISTDPVQISQLFTSGNIVEDSFEVEYLGAEERKPMQAVVRYREERRNQLPQERNVVVNWADQDDYAPLESFDLTSYCTTREHAELVGRYFLSVRKRITHTIRFRTLPYGMGLAPGSYIKVVTEASPYSSARNGVISDTGVVTSVMPLSDGQYSILYYKAGFEDVSSATMTLSDGRVTDSTLYGSLFTIVEATSSENIYMVEQLTLNEDGTVQITASEFPCDSRLSSLIAQDLTPDNRARFTFDN